MEGFKHFLDGGIGTYVPPLPVQEDLILCIDKSLHLLKLFIFVIEFTSYLSNFKSQEKLCKLKVNSKDKTLGNNHDIVSIAIKMKTSQKQFPILIIICKPSFKQAKSYNLNHSTQWNDKVGTLKSISYVFDEN